MPRSGSWLLPLFERQLCFAALLEGQVVLEENVDADALLRADDGDAIGLGLQHADGAAHLMAGILIEDGVDQSVVQRRPRMRRQFMGDDADRRRRSFAVSSAAIRPRLPAPRL